MTKKIIIDTDPGIDDAMAILFALNSPELEVVGLTTIFGNVHTDLATENALRLLEFAGQRTIPVAHGATKPLHIGFEDAPTFVHGENGLGEIELPAATTQADARPAAQFIVDMIMAHPREITLVPVGPLTNIALALALEPRIVANVADVVIMGGAGAVNGNVNPAAEANIWHDPHAADRVFGAGWPLTMVGLDVTEKTVMDEDFLAGLRASRTGTLISNFSSGFTSCISTCRYLSVIGSRWISWKNDRDLLALPSLASSTSTVRPATDFSSRVNSGASIERERGSVCFP